MWDSVRTTYVYAPIPMCQFCAFFPITDRVNRRAQSRKKHGKSTEKARKLAKRITFLSVRFWPKIWQTFENFHHIARVLLVVGVWEAKYQKKTETSYTGEINKIKGNPNIIMDYNESKDGDDPMGNWCTTMSVLNGCQSWIKWQICHMLYGTSYYDSIYWHFIRLSKLRLSPILQVVKKTEGHMTLDYLFDIWFLNPVAYNNYKFTIFKSRLIQL